MRTDDDRDQYRADNANNSIKFRSGGGALSEMNSGGEASRGASETLAETVPAEERRAGGGGGAGAGQGGQGGHGGGQEGGVKIIDRKTAELFASLVDKRIMVSLRNFRLGRVVAATPSSC